MPLDSQSQQNRHQAAILALGVTARYLESGFITRSVEVHQEAYRRSQHHAAKLGEFLQSSRALIWCIDKLRPEETGIRRGEGDSIATTVNQIKGIIDSVNNDVYRPLHAGHSAFLDREMKEDYSKKLRQAAIAVQKIAVRVEQSPPSSQVPACEVDPENRARS